MSEQLCFFNQEYMDNEARVYLIKLFKQSRPYELHYQYRTVNGKKLLKRDLPVLRKMVAAGEVQLFEVTPIWKKYRLVKEL